MQNRATAIPNVLMRIQNFANWIHKVLQRRNLCSHSVACACVLSIFSDFVWKSPHVTREPIRDSSIELHIHIFLQVDIGCEWYFATTTAAITAIQVASFLVVIGQVTNIIMLKLCSFDLLRTIFFTFITPFIFIPFFFAEYTIVFSFGFYNCRIDSFLSVFTS